MSKKIITITEIVEVNQVLTSKGLPFKVHLHDACGNQSFHVEPLEGCDNKDTINNMKEEVIRYFQGKYLKVRFLENNRDFIICI